jgi:hypothetical protein
MANPICLPRQPLSPPDFVRTSLMRNLVGKGLYRGAEWTRIGWLKSRTDRARPVRSGEHVRSGRRQVESLRKWQHRTRGIMSDRRRRDPTFLEDASSKPPAAPTFGAGGREPTIQDPYLPNGGTGGYPAQGDVASPPPSWSATPAPAQSWSGNAPAVPIGSAARPARQHTVLDDLTSKQPAPATPAGTTSSQVASAPAPARRIAGWLLSTDRTVGHVLRAGSNLVGRDPQHDVLIDDALVSGLQCNIICEVEETLLMPRPEARNPTMINGKRIYSTETIPPFAQVQFGGASFTYVPVPPSVES